MNNWKLILLVLTAFTFVNSITAQAVLWQEVADMPERVTNNAVTAATVNGVPYVYSFSGLDSTKSCDGDHLRSFRYNSQTDGWETIAPLPDPNGGKIAAGASTVKNIIYIIGGYHLAADCSETSSRKVHIYDPESNEYLPDGMDLPKAIDDQVQAVWRDSLIYVISGWSNTTNVRDVQIYNPAEDEWLSGTPLPSDAQWRVFGASGVIVGDTVYFAGGAGNWNGSNFPPTNTFRKGYINPADPTDITWSGSLLAGSRGYRMGAATFNDIAMWIGGSDITYNFDGIAYNGSGGVAALDRITYYNPSSGVLKQILGFIPSLMDLRGIAQIAHNQYVIAGGMEENQFVTDRTLLITIDALVNTREVAGNAIEIYPNPADFAISIDGEGAIRLEVFDARGHLVFEKNTQGGGTIDLPRLMPGTYLLKVWQDGVLAGTKKLVKK